MPPCLISTLRPFLGALLQALVGFLGALLQALVGFYFSDHDEGIIHTFWANLVYFALSRVVDDHGNSEKKNTNAIRRTAAPYYLILR